MITATSTHKGRTKRVVLGAAAVGGFIGIGLIVHHAVQEHPPIGDLSEADLDPSLPQPDISQDAGAEEGSTEHIEGRRYA